MNTNGTLQEGFEKNSFHMKYILSIALPLFFVAIFIFIVYTMNQSYSTSGDAVIRKIAGQILNKDPNSLGTKDFLEITELNLSGQTLEDIRLLKKFKNLRELDISRLEVSVAKIPVWKTILIKIHIIEKPVPGRGGINEKNNLLNLQPLRYLSRLEELNLKFTPIESLAPLSGLKNLQNLDIFGTGVFDLGPVGKLSNLKYLNLGQTKISDLKPLRDLSKLQRLNIYDTKISDIEPARNLTNLIYLDIRKCSNILYNQIDDLQTSLPELVIFDGREK